MSKTLEFDDLCAVFGDPRPHMREDGTVYESWPKGILGYAKIPNGGLPLAWAPEMTVNRFQCHRRLVRHFEEALERIHTEAAAWRSVNDFGGCYNFRLQRGSREPSKHSWGIAIDLDVRDNPMSRKPNVHPWVVQSFEMFGFVWGGTFKGSRIDPMHFEFADLSQL